MSAREHTAFFRGGYLYASASVCGIETCTGVVEGVKKKKREEEGGSFLNYVADLIQTVCMCIWLPQFSGNRMDISAKNEEGGLVRVCVSVLVIIKSRRATHLGVEKPHKHLETFLPSQISVAITTNYPSRYSGMISIPPDKKV